ncbi:MAG: hypothetical protein GY754_28235 [bacterium]|nr:hypothetical protein [bacterium]
MTFKNKVRYYFASILLLCAIAVSAQPAEEKPEPVDETIAKTEPELKEEKTDTPAPSRTYYYYRHEDFGASAFHDPLNIVIQGGFGAMRNRSIVDFDFVNGSKRLFSRLGNPFNTVSDYGWGNFFWDEFIPNTHRGQAYFPNYLWHLVGGGMRYKLMEEYYHYHGYEYPKLCAWISVYTMHIMNEIVQAEDQQNSVDAIADLYFFDLLANFLFEIDGVNRFMSRTLHFRGWSHQTQINLLTGRQGANWGQLYWMRVHIWGPWSISALTGEQVMFTLGPTFKFDSGWQLSCGMGPQTRNFVTADNGGADKEKLSLSYGIYLSKRDDPILTITYEPEIDPGTSDVAAIPHLNMAGDPQRRNEFSHKLVVNLYPGILKLGDMSFGLTFQYYKKAFYLGVSSGSWPVGFIFGTEAGDEYKNVY